MKDLLPSLEKTHKSVQEAMKQRQKRRKKFLRMSRSVPFDDYGDRSKLPTEDKDGQGPIQELELSEPSYEDYFHLPNRRKQEVIDQTTDWTGKEDLHYGI